MSKAAKLSQYRLARRLAFALYGREGHAWRDSERGGGDRCCAGRRSLVDGQRFVFVRRYDWPAVIAALQAAIAAKPERAA